jgi:Tol biopolymer transport system component
VKRAAILVALVAGLALPAMSQAALPGRDGRIAFASEWFPDDCGNHSCEEEVTGLNTVLPDGTHRRTLGRCGRRSANCEDHSAAWSPDGRRIAYIHDDTVWVMRANGSHSHRVFRGEASTPSWSPDGRHIVFTELDAYDGWITIMRPDGSHRRRLTHNTRNSDPSWSVGGLIAYTHYPEDFTGASSIVTRRPDGRRVGRFSAPHGVGNPDFSPDGRLLAFERYDNDDGISIWRAHPGGSGMREVAGAGVQPAWSPSGRSIAYSAPPGPFPANYEIFIARRDGSHVHRLGARRGKSAPPGEYIEPAWQPLPRR